MTGSDGVPAPRPEGGADPVSMRISDADRFAVAELLRQAAGDGRISLDELDQRLEATYAAKTYADLEPITVDLPGHLTSSPAVPSAGTPAVPPPPEKHVAILGGFDRSGPWVVPAEVSVRAILGGANIDLREATFVGRESVITINAFMGGAQVVVDERTNVVVEGTGIFGGYSAPGSEVRAELTPDSPTVRVRGVAILGGVSVVRKRR